MDSRADRYGHVMAVVDAVNMLPIMRLMTQVGESNQSAWSWSILHCSAICIHHMNGVTRLQWLCRNDNTINIVLGITSIITAAVCYVF